MIDSIQLKQFRSYSDESFEFSEGVNIIVGPNASGKSNLLEAILVIARGQSYRVDDTDLIMFQKQWARVDATTKNSTRTIKLTLTDKTTKSYIIDDKQYVRLPHTQALPVVLFEPNNLLLLSGQPEARRVYMDDLLEQISQPFLSARKHYKRVLSQRNALLKNNPHDITQQLFVWNVRLSELGGFIASERIALIEKLNQRLGDLYKNIAKSNTAVRAEYESKLPFATYETAMLKKLEESEAKDILRGFTTTGPHRDDLVLYFDGVRTTETASRGEVRTALLALKVFEAAIIEEVCGRKPIMLLDDVFSELDGKRRHALTDYLKNYQVFITTTDADIVGKKFTESSNLIALT